MALNAAGSHGLSWLRVPFCLFRGNYACRHNTLLTAHGRLAVAHSAGPVSMPHHDTGEPAD